MSYETEDPLSAIVAEMREHPVDETADIHYDGKSWKKLCDRIEESSVRFADEVNSLICHLVITHVRHSQAESEIKRLERELDNVCKAFTGQ